MVYSTSRAVFGFPPQAVLAFQAGTSLTVAPTESILYIADAAYAGRGDDTKL